MDIFYPLSFFVDWLIFSIFGFAQESYIGAAVRFFIYDAVKIGLLLLLINYLMAFIRHYFPMNRAKIILSKRRWFGLNYLLAALLGVITPFCSCSSIPLFLGFTGVGIPLGVTFAFLISSPMINEASLYLFPAMFGWRATILYNIFGLSIAVLGGMIMQRLKLEKYIIFEFLETKPNVAESVAGSHPPFRKMIAYCWREGLVLTKRIFPYVLLGVGIGALIHGFIPDNLVTNYLNSSSWWTVPVAVVLGVPLYANSVSVLPVMEALAGKGVPLGTVLAFMTAVVALSLPEALILKKVMRWPLLAVFFGITTVGILLMGFLFNLIL